MQATESRTEVQAVQLVYIFGSDEGFISMPKTKNEPSFNIRLARQDLSDFDELCQVEGKNRSQLARELIREGLERRKLAQQEELEGPFATEIKKQTDRLIGVIRKNNIDQANRLATILTKLYLNDATSFHVLYHRTAPEARDELFALARKQSIEMLKGELKGPMQKEALEVVKNALSGEA